MVLFVNINGGVAVHILLLQVFYHTGAVCNVFNHTGTVCDASLSIRRLYEHHMVPCDVCDGQDPTLST